MWGKEARLPGKYSVGTAIIFAVAWAAVLVWWLW
jgi:hypothetical protein